MYFLRVFNHFLSSAAAPKVKTVTAVVERESSNITESHRDQSKQENDQTESKKKVKLQVKVSSDDVTNAKEKLEFQNNTKMLGKKESDTTELEHMIQEESSPLSDARETTVQGSKG